MPVCQSCKNETPHRLYMKTLGVCRKCRNAELNPPGPPPGPLGRCDCGHDATHENVPLRVGQPNGNVKEELYNLCDDCLALENEPVYSRGTDGTKELKRWR